MGRVWKVFTEIVPGDWKEELVFRQLNVSSTIPRSAHLIDSSSMQILTELYSRKVREVGRREQFMWILRLREYSPLDL